MLIHETLVSQAKEMIDEVFSDTSVGPEKTLLSLREIETELRVKIRVLEESRRIRSGRR